ncbi:hypothetical protein GGI43DRAFT_383029 [Trichoderma evansii]
MSVSLGESILIRCETQQSTKCEDESYIKATTSNNNKNNPITLENCDPSTPAASQRTPWQGTWNIDNIVNTLTVPKAKRPSSALESVPKQVNLGHDEILKQVNKQAKITQESIQKAQLEQHLELREVHGVVQKNTQTLDSMQNDLRQFMSAVASTLKDIREQLDE